MDAIQPAARRSRVGLLVGMTGLLVGLLAFHQLGSGWLQAPPADPDGWAEWLRGRDPLVATVALLRLVVLVLGWYLLAVTALGALARLLRAPRLVRAADRVTLPAVRRLLRDTLGATLATAMIASGSSVAGPVVAAHAAPPEIADVLPGFEGQASDEQPEPRVVPTEAEGDVRRPDDGVAQATLPGTSLPLPLDVADSEPATDGRGTAPVDGSGEAGEAVDDASQAEPPVGGADGTGEVGDDGVGQEPGGRRGRSVDPPTTAPHAQQTPPSRGPGATSPADPAATSPAGEVTVAGERAVVVQPGDSLWSIASDALRGANEPTPDDAEVAAYWSAVVEHNRPHLADPDNPDLIFPGDTVLLPPVPDRMAR